jgi:Asp-tRNA(Asn)/Glu-tRNA(Gln) amidotransferase A subunit family amidase
MPAATLTVDDAAYISRLDRSRASGPFGGFEGLAGVPFAVKDNIETRDYPTTAGTAALRGNLTGRNARVVQQLVDAGAVVVGKTNMHELGLGVTSNNATFGPVRHPVDPSKSAGGSSGGSAVAVARSEVPFALGTDTGGSVRIPASFCGIVGYRPSTGRYSSEGLVNISWTRDTIGILAKSMEWITEVDAAITGRKAADPDPGRRIRLGVPGDFYERLDPGVERVIADALDLLERQGVDLVELHMGGICEASLEVGFPIIDYETEHALRRYLGSRSTPMTFEEFCLAEHSPDVRKILQELAENPVAPAIYQAALEERRELQNRYRKAFAGSDIDALAYPTVVTTAPALGEDEVLIRNGANEPLLRTIVTNTTPSTVAATPSISLPAGLSDEGMPVGLALEGLPGDDVRLLNIAMEVEDCLRSR